MGQHQSVRYTPHVAWLKDKAFNVYTQFGEDGLIEACLKKIGETNRHCFEIGASDGSFFSNTLILREKGWYAVLIEANEKLYEKLKADYGSQSTCIHRTCVDLDAVLRETNINLQPDLGIIDIDGQDFWMWNDLQDVRPRIMLVEISTRSPSEPPPERYGEGQAGMDAIRYLGESKGYTLVAETFCNALFVDSGELN